MDETQHGEPEFDAFAEDYDKALDEGLKLSGESKDYFAEGRMKWLRKRLASLSHSAEKVLDFGCGTGSATPFFFQHLGIFELVGTDPSEKSLALAREKWKRFSAQFQPSSEEKGFDTAFCNGVFHHIPPAERNEAAQSVFDSLVSGGYFAFWENNPWNPVTRYAMSRVPFDRDAILVYPHEARKLLRRRGFEVIGTDYVFFFPRQLAVFRGLEPNLSWLPFGGQYLVLCRKP